MDLASCHTRRKFAPLALPALRRVDVLLQLLRKRIWLSGGFWPLSATVVCVALHDDNIFIRVQHIDKMWVVFRKNLAKVGVRMEGSTNDAVLAYLRPLVRRGLELGRPCTVAVFPSARLTAVAAVAYSGPELDLDTRFDYLRDIPTGGFMQRLAVLLDMIIRNPAGCYAADYSVFSWLTFRTVLLTSGQLQTTIPRDWPRFHGDVSQTLEYVRRLPDHFTTLDLLCMQPDTQQTVARFSSPSFDLQNQFRHLI